MDTLGIGLIYLLAGMGGVFLFLLILVWAMTLMHRLVEWLNRRFPPEDSMEDEKLAVALAAAAHRRRSHK